jgi:hypothetical protein
MISADALPLEINASNRSRSSPPRLILVGHILVGQILVGQILVGQILVGHVAPSLWIFATGQDSTFPA